MSSSQVHHTMIYLKNEDYEKLKKSALAVGLSVSKYVGLVALGKISRVNDAAPKIAEVLTQCQ